MLIDVDKDTGVVCAVGSGKADAGGDSAASASDVDLVAGHVELGTTSATGGVKGDCLSSKEILSRSNGRGYCEGVMTTVVLSESDYQTIEVQGRG